MTTSRKLEDIASNLDDMSDTLEEIKEEIKGTDRGDTDTKLDKVQSDMERAADVIEESLDPTAEAITSRRLRNAGEELRSIRPAP